MYIDQPSDCRIPALRQLWKLAFGDPDVFLDSFFSTGFSRDRCRCVLEDDRIAAMLYWFDCTVRGRKIAYLYALATHPEFRNRGFARTLMESTHSLLAAQGYSDAMLVPQQESLRKLYAGMGYRNCGGLNILTCTAAETAVPLRAVGPEEFASLRRQYLPENSVVQEGENLAFLAQQLQFYAGDDFLLAAYAEDRVLHGTELLGSTAAASGIVSALDCSSGSFRTPGMDVPFAMFRPLTDTAAAPAYFGFAFD